MISVFFCLKIPRTGSLYSVRQNLIYQQQGTYGFSLLYGRNGTVLECKGKLNLLEQQMCGDVFMRCHQSFLVNMYQVNNMKGSEVTVSGERIPVSGRYYAEGKRRYHEILFEEVD